jgi:hypothetical protein
MKNIAIKVKKLDTKELDTLKKQLSKSQVANATRMALNDSIRKGKTETKRSITEMYNIKPSLIDYSDRKKGLSTKLATKSNLSAEVDAGHIPISLSEANPQFKSVVVASQVKYKNGKAKKGKNVKRSVGQISIEIIKGQRKIISSAFAIGIGTNATTGKQFTTPAIFARGKRGKPTFQFGKSRYPIDSLSTVSIATATLNVKAKEKVQPIITAFYQKSVARQMQRLIDKGK